MSRSYVALFGCVLLIACLGTGSAAGAPTGASIVEIYPNTHHPDNAGEYVVVAFPAESDLAAFSLADGETSTPLGTETVSGTVAFSRTPETTREMVEYPVYELPERFEMAQSGETIRLRRNSEPVDEATYERAPDGERWILADDGWEWRPRGATEFDARDLPAERATAFSLPDSPETPIETLRDADERLYLAGYSFHSERALESLIAAHERGVEVRVLVDGTPVGGQSKAEAAALDRLSAAGVEVRVFEGSARRYRYHHPKYAVVDDRALVMTENWKPAGTGGESSRGWGVVVEGEAVATELAAVFEADAGWEDTAPWDRSLAGTLVEADPPDGEFADRFEPTTAEVESVRVVTAPDNAEVETLSLLSEAEESIRIQQPTIARDHAFLEAAVDAAKRGVEVRILLDSSWYVEEENRELVRWLEDQAEAGGLPIEARLVDSERFEKLHAKGVVVDDHTAMVGSLNWNANSVENNREVALIVESEAIAGHFATVFETDWEDGGGGRPSLPVGLGLGVAAATGGAVLVGSRVLRFD
ncbi:phospholipase D-like domain-containing protein [Halalkalicoccus jeotgali]|uniref:phospholipase D/Transphosphatidylase n=1 Tax=Halalkalicoccus jeotgali (strain DSM 18796 / CECT 7217 / JCM 14584 / KCTC 4019 / B3) TaxID=795797 RepID=D8J4S7_HALJB|nr:phospholipase D-like domain-containing protein [Halalkalicoccus jeotgali]ADJ15544.1 phospholipase D/Transphosphatidylase [Halalkalicoccus jeotgali B3]ELY36047.1 phospholipase D/transphosphatidylase [Halalkalicoccus jeotgali B3]